MSDFLPEVQRICAVGPESLPSVLLVDVGALLRWAVELNTDPKNVLGSIEAAAARSHRRIVCIVAPTVWPYVGVDDENLDSAADRLRLAGLDVLRSKEPLAGMLARVCTPGQREIGIVSAGLDGRRYEFAPLDRHVLMMLDVATGKTWLDTEVLAAFGEPALQPWLDAMRGCDLDAMQPLIGDAKSGEAGRILEDAAKESLPPDEDMLPARAAKAFRERRVDIDKREAVLRGEAEEDKAAGDKLREWLLGPDPRADKGAEVAAEAPRDAPTDTAVVDQPTLGAGNDECLFVVGNTVAMADGTSAIGSVVAQLGCDRWSADGKQAESLLRDLQRRGVRRWVVPRALDLLGAMVDRGLELPESVDDPGIAAFCLDPDKPLDLEGVCPPGSWTADALDWVSDHKRQAPPPQVLDVVLALLPRLHGELDDRQRQQGLVDLSRSDIAPTLPALARIERQGAWVLPPDESLEKMRRAIDEELQEVERELRRARVPLDAVYQKEPDEAVDALRNIGLRIPEARWVAGMSAKQHLDRLAVTHATAGHVVRARQLAAMGGVQYWLRQLDGRHDRLRAHHVPLRSGRWGLREPPLHNLPKHTPDARVLRSRLSGPPGHSLVAADYSAFEARIFAALTGNDLLVRASTDDGDMHLFLASELRGADTANAASAREAVKAAVYAFCYGQNETGFVREQATMTTGDARAVYRRCRERLPTAAGLGSGAHNVETLGGWQRWAGSGATPRGLKNTRIQGSGADILRLVLRTLDRELRPFNAFVVHQAHDEVIVATPLEVLAEVERVLIHTMVEVPRLHGRLGAALVDSGVKLRVKVSKGNTWADLL